MKWISSLWEMSHIQLRGYFQKHRKSVNSLYSKLENQGGKSFPEWKLFEELMNGYKILEHLISQQEDFYQSKIKFLSDRVSTLEKRLHLNPENSHRPPSSSKFKKIKNQRVKTGKETIKAF